MSTGRDDDALSWAGDDDPTLDVGAHTVPVPATAAPAPPSLPVGYTAVGKGSDLPRRADQPVPDGGDVVTAPEPDAPASVGNAALIGLGVLGGVYLLFTIGWVIGGLRLQPLATFLVSPAAFVPALWLAALAPAIWFGVTLLLTRASAAWVRFAWLAAGVALFIPWPFIMIGAVGR